MVVGAIVPGAPPPEAAGAVGAVAAGAEPATMVDEGAPDNDSASA